MSRPAATAKAKSENSLIRYFRDTRTEISKVTWPTREEGIRLTLIVVVATIASGALLFGVDSMFAAVVGLLIQI